MRAHRRLLVASIVGAIASAGCAGTSVLPGHGHDFKPSAFDQSVTVIKGWSTALRTGHVRAAAEYFQIPSVFVNGPEDVFVLHSFAAAVIINRLLPCGAEYVSATQRGAYIDALFKLTDRSGPGGGSRGCGSGAGTTARVNFIISDGKITHWLRAPSQPGDNRTTPPAGGGSSGTATSPGGSSGTATSPGGSTGTATSPGGSRGTATSPGGSRGTATSPGGSRGTATSPGTNTVPPGTSTAPTAPGPSAGTATEPTV
jgi:hypothetical protein